MVEFKSLESVWLTRFHTIINCLKQCLLRVCRVPGLVVAVNDNTTKFKGRLHPFCTFPYGGYLFSDLFPRRPNGQYCKVDHLVNNTYCVSTLFPKEKSWNSERPSNKPGLQSQQRIEADLEPRLSSQTLWFLLLHVDALIKNLCEITTETYFSTCKNNKLVFAW